MIKNTNTVDIEKTPEFQKLFEALFLATPGLGKSKEAIEEINETISNLNKLDDITKLVALVKNPNGEVVTVVFEGPPNKLKATSTEKDSLHNAIWGALPDDTLEDIQLYKNGKPSKKVDVYIKYVGKFDKAKEKRNRKKIA